MLPPTSYFGGALPNLTLQYTAHQMRSRCTPIEKKMWSYLQKRPFKFRFKQKQIIGPYIVDFYCEELQVVIQVDEARILRNLPRDRALVSNHNMTVIRLFDDEVFDASAMEYMRLYLKNSRGARNSRANKAATTPRPYEGHPAC